MTKWVTKILGQNDEKKTMGDEMGDENFGSRWRKLVTKILRQNDEKKNNGWRKWVTKWDDMGDEIGDEIFWRKFWLKMTKLFDEEMAKNTL